MEEYRYRTLVSAEDTTFDGQLRICYIHRIGFWTLLRVYKRENWNKHKLLGLHYIIKRGLMFYSSKFFYTKWRKHFISENVILYDVFWILMSSIAKLKTFTIYEGIPNIMYKIVRLFLLTWVLMKFIGTYLFTVQFSYDVLTPHVQNLPAFVADMPIADEDELVYL